MRRWYLNDIIPANVHVLVKAINSFCFHGLFEDYVLAYGEGIIYLLIAKKKKTIVHKQCMITKQVRWELKRQETKRGKQLHF